MMAHRTAETSFFPAFSTSSSPLKPMPHNIIHKNLVLRATDWGCHVVLGKTSCNINISRVDPINEALKGMAEANRVEPEHPED
jgi:hypothetical protein